MNTTPPAAAPQQNDDLVLITMRRGGATLEWSARSLQDAVTRMGAYWPALFAGPARELAALEAMAVAVAGSLEGRQQ